MKKFCAALTVCLFAVGAAYAADEVKSGLTVGDGPVPAFNVRDITGPSKGKTLCYRCQYGARPVVTVFTRELTPEVKDLVAKIDEKVGANRYEGSSIVKSQLVRLAVTTQQPSWVDAMASGLPPIGSMP